MATDLRLACMRISRRVRFESSHDVAPHQFSVLCRLEEAPRTPGELAEIERVASPEHDPDRRRPRRARPACCAGRPDRRPLGDPVADRRRASVRSPRSAASATSGWPAASSSSPTEEQDVLARATAILAKVAGE